MDIPKNKAINIREIAKMYKEKYNEELPDIVDNLGYIHEVPKPKERSTAELIAEAQKIIDRKEPEIVPVSAEPPKTKHGTVKELARILEHAFDY